MGVNCRVIFVVVSLKTVYKKNLYPSLGTDILIGLPDIKTCSASSVVVAVIVKSDLS